MKNIRIMLLLAIIMSTGLTLVELSGIWKPLSLAERVIEVADPISGQEYELQFRLCNWSLSEIQLIGGHETCGIGGCVTIPGVPCKIPRLSERSIGIKYEAKALHDHVEFEREITIYTNSTVQPKVVFSIRGRVQHSPNLSGLER